MSFLLLKRRGNNKKIKHRWVEYKKLGGEQV